MDWFRFAWGSPRRRSGWIHWIGVLAGLAFACTAAEAGSRPSTVSICEIVDHPLQFEGRRVAIRARMIGERHHGYLLVDAQRGCRWGIRFKLPDKTAANTTDVEKWEGAMSMILPKDAPEDAWSWDRDVTVELTGTVRSFWRREDDWSGSYFAASSTLGPSPGDVGRQVIEIETIDSISIYNLLQPRADIEAKALSLRPHP